MPSENQTPLTEIIEAAIKRIFAGAGIYPDPRCPNCKIRRAEWEERDVGCFVFHATEQLIPCPEHVGKGI